MASVLQLGPASICQILVLNSTTMTTIPNRMLQLISAWRQRRSATRSDECDECAGNQFPPHCSLLPSPPLPPLELLSHMQFCRKYEVFIFGFSNNTKQLHNQRKGERDRQTAARSRLRSGAPSGAPLLLQGGSNSQGV